MCVPDGQSLPHFISFFYIHVLTSLLMVLTAVKPVGVACGTSKEAKAQAGAHQMMTVVKPLQQPATFVHIPATVSKQTRWLQVFATH